MLLFMLTLLEPENAYACGCEHNPSMIFFLKTVRDAGYWISHQAIYETALKPVWLRRCGSFLCNDFFFSSVATWLCSVDGFSCRCRPVVFHTAAQLNSGRGVVRRRFLVGSRVRTWMRSERSSVWWEEGRRGSGGRSRCDAVVLAAVTACMLRFNRAQFCLCCELPS